MVADRSGFDASGNEDFDHARELLRDQREDEALDLFEVAIGTSAEPRVIASAAAHVAALLLGFGRPWEVTAFAATVREHGSPALGDMLEAAACIQLGDPLGALQLLGDSGPVPEPRDDWFPCSRAGAQATRVRALALSGRDGDARRELETALRATPDGHELWEALATLTADGLVDPARFVVHLEPARVVDLFGWIAAAPPTGLDAIAEALWNRVPGDRRVLAASTLFAWRLEPERAREWTLRLLEAGVTERSPLLERAEIVQVAPVERVRAALCGAPLDEARARRAVAGAIDGVHDDEIADLLDRALDAGTGIVDAVIVGAATTTERCLRLAARLCDRGHHTEALAVVVAGLSLPEADDLRGAVFARLLPEAHRHALARVAAARGDDEVAAILESVPTEVDW